MSLGKTRNKLMPFSEQGKDEGCCDRVGEQSLALVGYEQRLPK